MRGEARSRIINTYDVVFENENDKTPYSRLFVLLNDYFHNNANQSLSYRSFVEYTFKAMRGNIIIKQVPKKGDSR